MTNETKIIGEGQLAVIVPKTKPELVFKYNDSKDLENLISFVGVKPSIDFEKGKIIPRFKKVVVLENSIVFRNSFGEIRLMDEKTFNQNFDIQAVKDYSSQYENKVQAKEAKTKTSK